MNDDAEKEDGMGPADFLVFQELEYQIQCSDKIVAGVAISAMGEFAIRFRRPGKVIERLILVVTRRLTPLDPAIQYAMLVIKRLFPRISSPATRKSSLLALFRHLDLATADTPVLSNLFWLMTQYVSDLGIPVALDILR